MWTAERPTPRESRFAEFAAWRVRRRATESAPPEMATQMRSPGLMLERSKGSVVGILFMVAARVSAGSRLGFTLDRCWRRDWL